MTWMVILIASGWMAVLMSVAGMCRVAAVGDLMLGAG